MPMDRTAAATPPPLDEQTRRRLAAFVRLVGERRARELLDVARPLLARALAGLPIRRASAEVLRVRLDVLDARRADGAP